MTDDGASMAADVAIQTAQGFVPREAMELPVLGRVTNTELGSKWPEGDAHAPRISSQLSSM